MLRELIYRKKLTVEEKQKKYFDKHVKLAVRKEEPSLRILAFFDKNYIGEIKTVIYSEENKIMIGDFIIKKEWYRNRGFGTELMNKFMEIAKEYNPKKIYGNLARVDISNKDRLIHFYQKYGFNIIFEEDNMNFARIEKIFNNKSY